MNATPDSSDLYRPAASLERLQARSRLVHETREFFHARGYWEVETPVLSAETVIDLHLDPFTAAGSFGLGSDEPTFFLQTSPEFAMKRLLTAGADRIFQITRAFRQGEAGQLHNPEFTILEWYAVGETHFDQMEFVEQLCRHLFIAAGRGDALPEQAFSTLTYAEAFQKALSIDVLTISLEELRQLTVSRGLPDSEPNSRLTVEEQKDDLLNVLLTEVVEPELAKRSAVFLHDYPVSQAALAQANPSDARVAERFELYLQGVEICNGYHELTDAAELRRRNRRQNELRAEAGLPRLPENSRLLEAMEAGMPASSGTAVGLDRLLMLALGCKRLQDVLAFPVDRA
ncbi:EF-P lysine aminoacylase GenX [bacterium]|nr:EF-P lysine aminoacylase GenX [bacterium]